jgi:hypothetical protein
MCALCADDVVRPGAPQLDRPTLMALGVKLPVGGDDNYHATVPVRYRKSGNEAWRQALPLYLVRPETVRGWKVEPQFSGSIFDLRPATTYEIELRVADPDGEVDQTLTLSGTTRGVPGDPATPNQVAVDSAAGLWAALSAAKPGDVITLADGVYDGSFTIRAGAAENPIVTMARAGTAWSSTVAAQAATCWKCTAPASSIERLTLQNANRALRFQTQAAEANVVRRCASEHQAGHRRAGGPEGFHIVRILEGRLAWPSVYTDDNGARSNDDGIRVQGFGHVIAHNRISGYGDAMKVEQDGARAIDFYGNEILSAYDNAVELDASEANARCLRNRFTNTYATLSVQPIYGGPAYLIRNVVVNVTHEQMKFHALGGIPPRESNGIFAWHNTFVSPGSALNLETSDATHHFVTANNLFVGGARPPNGRTVNWTGPIDDGVFDYNGYSPDGGFTLNLPLAQVATRVLRTSPQCSGVESKLTACC